MSTLYHNPARRTEADMKAGADRVSLMRDLRFLIGRGYSLQETARKLGISAAQACILKNRFEHLADYELTSENLATERGEGARRIDAEIVARQPEAVKELQQLYLSTIQGSSEYITKGRRTGSASLALQRFADWPQCPPNLARALRRGSQPKALLNVIRQMNDLHEQLYRGAKHASLNGTLVQRRESIEVLADGTKVPIQPGDWWVFDDMSTNFPFHFKGPDGKDYVGRQGLYAYDVCQRWIGCELVGTCRDSYTAAIILRFFRRLFQALGKPRRGVVLERSVWAAQSIAGFRITQSLEVYEEEVIRPAMSSEDKALIHDGLEAIGVKVHYTYTPRGKEIEGGFAYLQRVFPTFARDWQNIGHHAGEFEKGAKALRRAHAASHDPADLQFLHIDAHADLTEKTMAWINARKDWADNKTPIAELPRLAELTRRDMAAFLPARSEVKIINGCVRVQHDGQVEEFVNPVEFAKLGSNFRFYVKWDPSEPTIGAAIYCRETSSANFGGWQKGEFMFWAEYKPTVPRFDWREKGDDAAGRQKRMFNKAARTAFRAVGMPALRAATLRDGKGNVAEVNSTPSPPRSGGEGRGEVVPDVALDMPSRHVRQMADFNVPDDEMANAPSESEVKEYVLDAPAASAPTVAQYWAIWRKVEAVKPGLNRFALTHKTIGHVPKVRLMTDAERLKMVQVFSAITRDAKAKKDLLARQAARARELMEQT